MTRKTKVLLGLAGVLLASAAAAILYNDKKNNYKLTKRIKQAGKSFKGNVEKAAMNLKNKYESVSDAGVEKMKTFSEKKYPSSMQ